MPTRIGHRRLRRAPCASSRRLCRRRFQRPKYPSPASTRRVFRDGFAFRVTPPSHAEAAIRTAVLAERGIPLCANRSTRIGSFQQVGCRTEESRGQRPSEYYAGQRRVVVIRDGRQSRHRRDIVIPVPQPVRPVDPIRDLRYPRSPRRRLRRGPGCRRNSSHQRCSCPSVPYLRHQPRGPVKEIFRRVKRPRGPRVHLRHPPTSEIPQVSCTVQSQRYRLRRSLA